MKKENDISKVLIAFGSNEGDSLAVYERVQSELVRHSMVLQAASEPIQTEPIGGVTDEPQNTYLNAALLVETKASPEQAIQSLLEIEKELGRVRDRRWSPRTVDLDLLLFDQLEMDQPKLTCPHPRMSYRRFVLKPAAEVAPDMVHPVSGCTIARLLEQLDTRSNVLVWVGELIEEIEQLDGWTTRLGQVISVVEAGQIDQVESAPNDSSFQICHVDTMDEFRRVETSTKLVSFLDHEGADAELFTSAKRFAGATLRLGANALDPRREIVSAIEAML